METSSDPIRCIPSQGRNSSSCSSVNHHDMIAYHHLLIDELHLPTERSSLLEPSKSPSFRRRLPRRRGALQQGRPSSCLIFLQYSVATLLAILVVFVEYESPRMSSLQQDYYYKDKSPGRRTRVNRFHSFPENFVWGTATSAYQVEGGSDERGVSIWDMFCEDEHPNGSSHIIDSSSGYVACDHYHKMEQDVQLMKDLGLQAYRFSIAWTRILPDDSKVSQSGIDFYNRLIDSLINVGIVPYITLFHWDLPQRLETKYGGWLGREIVYDFGDFARICFHHFGDRVKHWITINEPWSIAVNGYNGHVQAPGHFKHPETETYLVAHHLLLAHARAVHIYRRDFAGQRGVIGISNCGDFRFPADATSDADWDAAERAMVFQVAWFADPIWLGDYPKEMRDRLGSRLPRFSREEQYMLKGSSDFFGLNHYSSLLAAEPQQSPNYKGYWADIFVDFSTRNNWLSNAMGWSVVPAGCREMLIWIAERYDNPIILMTENGSAELEPDLDAALNDEARRHYIESYLRACAQAIEEGVDLRGYFAWSFMDNFEWQFGYQRKFGLCHVDFDSLERTPKASAFWYQATILANGHNIRRNEVRVFQ